MTRRHWYIIGALCGILVIGALIWGLVYLPHFGCVISGDNAEWGGFGQFFFGLGTLLLAGVTVFIMLGIDTHLHRSTVIGKYMQLLELIVNAINEKEPKKIRTTFKWIHLHMLMISVNDNFSKSIRARAILFAKEFEEINIDQQISCICSSKQDSSVDDAVGDLGDFITRLCRFSAAMEANKDKWPKSLKKESVKQEEIN